MECLNNQKKPLRRVDSTARESQQKWALPKGQFIHCLRLCRHLKDPCMMVIKRPVQFIYCKISGKFIGLNDSVIDSILSFLGCEDDDKEIRRLSYGIYKSCWMLNFLEERCHSHVEWAKHCKYSCGYCRKMLEVS